MICSLTGIVLSAPRTQLLDTPKGILLDDSIHERAEWYFSSGRKLKNAYTSFCPDQDGSWIIRAYVRHYGGIWVQSEYNGSEYGQDNGCYYDAEDKWDFRLKLFKNKCYDVRGWETNDGCSGGHLKLYTVNPQGIETFITSKNSYAKHVTDCIPGFYGTDCQNAVDLDCNNGGNPSDGLNGDANLCVCTNGMTTPFCEDMNFLPAGHQDLLMSVFVTSQTPVETSYTTFGGGRVDLRHSYSRITFSGKIKIPQNGYYDFQVNSHTGAVFEIAKVLQIGEMGDVFICSIDKTVTRTTGKIFIERGVYDVRVNLNSGCSMVDQFLDLKWKFYRYYQNSDNTPWEYIPRRYLTSSN